MLLLPSLVSPRLAAALALGGLLGLASPRLAQAISCGSVPIGAAFTRVDLSASLAASIPFVSDCTLDGNTSFDETRGPGLGSTPSLAHSTGDASFKALSASVEMSGASAFRAVTSASSQEFFTIDKAGALPGEMGTMVVHLHLGGSATVLDPSGNGISDNSWAAASLSLSLGNPTLVPGAQSLFSNSYPLANGSVLATVPGGGGGIAVPFEYGVPFGLYTHLSVGAKGDPVYHSGSDSYTYGTVGSVMLDFSHTLGLDALVLTPGDVLSALSSTDYTPLVRFTAVPEPGPSALLGAGLAALAVGLRGLRRDGDRAR